jgi:hypothetical protein
VWGRQSHQARMPAAWTSFQNSNQTKRVSIFILQRHIIRPTKDFYLFLLIYFELRLVFSLRQPPPELMPQDMFKDFFHQKHLDDTGTLDCLLQGGDAIAE